MRVNGLNTLSDTRPIMGLKMRFMKEPMERAKPTILKSFNKFHKITLI
jgi:hypothetical protein